MSKNLSLAVINIGYFILVAWYINYCHDANAFLAIVFLLLLDVLLGVFMN